MTPPVIPADDGPGPWAADDESPGLYLTTPALRERGWTGAMIRDYLGEPDSTQPNPRYRSAAPMKLYLAERARAAEAIPQWAERRAVAATRHAAGVATAERKRAATPALARQLAADLAASLVLPADPEQAAIAAYNQWHAHRCTCPDWQERGTCGKRAATGDSPELLGRITLDYARRMLPGYGRACHQLARRVGPEEAEKLLRAAVDAAVALRLGLPGTSAGIAR